jgi:GAF domain-containing protein
MQAAVKKDLLAEYCHVKDETMKRIRKLNSREEKKYEELVALTEINREIHSTMNINRLLQILVEKAVVAVNFERCLIYLLENDFLRCAAWIDRVKREKASIIKKKVGFRLQEVSVETLSVKTGKTIYVPNARNDERVSPKLLRISDTWEYCAVPLIGREQVLGVITGDKRYSNAPITTAEIETLNLFASHISLAVENAKLYQEKEAFNQTLEQTIIEKTSELLEANQQLSKRMEQLSTLHKMSELLNESLEKDAVLCKVGLMLESMGYNTFSIWVREKEEYSMATATGLDDSYQKLPYYPIDREKFKVALASGNPFFIEDLTASSVIPICRNYYVKKGLQSCLVVPVATY